MPQQRTDSPAADDQQATSEAFEDRTCARWRSLNIPAHRHTSKAAQYAHGDTDIGIELKYDQKLQNEPHNLAVETREKRWHQRDGETLEHYKQRPTVPSGIFADHDATHFGIGDDSILFVFDRKHLIELAAVWRIIPVYIRVNGEKVQSGNCFLLTYDEASYFSKCQFHWSDRRSCESEALKLCQCVPSLSGITPSMRPG